MGEQPTSVVTLVKRQENHRGSRKLEQTGIDYKEIDPDPTNQMLYNDSG